jgi:hypothetical protein
MIDLGEYIATGLGTLAVILLGILLRQTVRNGEKLDAHILKMAEIIPQKVSVADCAVVRGQCVQMLSKIIGDPLDQRIEEISRKRNDRWTRQGENNKAVWIAIKTHTHTKIENNTDDQVIIPEKKG